MTTSMTTECPRSDLPPNMCWHCRGHEHVHVDDLDDGPDGDWPPPERPTPIAARVSGKCRWCGHPIERGELIVEGDAGWVHDECVPF